MINNVFKFQKSSYKLIIAMVIISILAVLFAVIYYGNINRTKDPRTIHIKELYKKYSLFVEKNDFGNALETLDLIEKGYKNIEHYKESYEIGVIITNKATVHLTLAMHHSPEKIEKESNLNISEKLLNSSLDFYIKWKKKYNDLSQADISDLVNREFQDITTNREDIIANRIKEINLALTEIDRRMSVTYTNLGIVKRHQEKYQEAIELYQKALKLWEDNLAAENNLRILLGKETRKKNFIQKMFPKKRK